MVCMIMYDNIRKINMKLGHHGGPMDPLIQELDLSKGITGTRVLYEDET